jgi:hypothetical protein
MTKQNLPRMQIGEMMPDKTISAGISPDTGKPMYTTPRDASVSMTFNHAKDSAAKLDAHGHSVPTTAELGVLFNNRSAIRGFEPLRFAFRRFVLVLHTKWTDFWLGTAVL